MSSIVMHLILHIGTEKTGTTSIQNWFANKSDLLEQDGIWYPSCLRLRYDHRLFTSCAKDPKEPDEIARSLNIDSVDKHAEFVRTTRTAFVEEFETAKAAGAKWCVISSEHLHSRFNSIEDVKRAKSLFEDLFDQITGVLFLRPQVDMAVSLASTASRQGQTILPNWFESIESTSPYYDYDTMVTWWEDVLGANNLHVLPYKRQTSALDWFATHLDIQIDESRAAVRKNTAIGFPVMQLTNLLTPTFRSNNGDRNPNINVGHILEQLPNHHRLVLGRGMMDRLHAKFEDSNNRLIARRPELEDGDLTSDRKGAEDGGNAWKLSRNETLVHPLNALVERLNARGKLEKAHRLLLEVELEQAQTRAAIDIEKNLAEAAQLLDEAHWCPPLRNEVESLRMKLEALKAL